MLGDDRRVTYYQIKKTLGINAAGISFDSERTSAKNFVVFRCYID